MANMAECMLENDYNLNVLSLYTHKHPFLEDEIPPGFIEKTLFEAHYVNTKLSVLDAYSALITNDSYNISRFHSVDFDLALEKHLDLYQYDVVQLESLFMTVYIGTIRRCSNAKIVLRSHNFEYQIWERQALYEKSLFKKKYLNHLAEKIKEYEEDILSQLDGIITISPLDKKAYSKIIPKTPVSCIPFGINEVKKCGTSRKNPSSFFYLGAMDWKPNIQAVNWFVENVWQKFSQENPTATFNIGGRKLVPNLFKKISGLGNHGEVENADTFMCNGGIMLVPLFSGGGIRVKIIEAMAKGIAIIATNIAVEGIPVTHKKNVWLANTKEEFINALQILSEDSLLVKRLQEESLLFVNANYSNESIKEKLNDFYYNEMKLL